MVQKFYLKGFLRPQSLQVIKAKKGSYVPKRSFRARANNKAAKHFQNTLSWAILVPKKSTARPLMGFAPRDHAKTKSIFKMVLQ